MKQINPIEGMMKTMGALSGITTVDRSDVFNDKFNNIVVDTVEAFDTHEWETGIEIDGKWIIVEQYETREKAKSGHNEWVKTMKKNPKKKLKDVNVWSL